MSKARRKKNEETKRRFEAIKDLMSTFAMSTVAVVAVVTLIPSSPKAELTKVVALSEEIAYQVNVTDEDNALDLSTLFVVLENQLEYYEHAISLGENSGYFDNLSIDTEYRLSVYGNKGFGQERLDTVKITTGEKIGGTILGVTINDPEIPDYLIVDFSINDPNSEYTRFNLNYSIINEEGIEIKYAENPIESTQNSFTLDNIYPENEIIITLQGVNLSGEKFILDEIIMNPTLDYNLHFEAFDIDSNNIIFGIYNYQNLQIKNIELALSIDDKLIRTEQLVLIKNEYEEYVIIDNLLPKTQYKFVFKVTYKNPQTLRSEEMIIEKLATTQEELLHNKTIDIFLNREVTK